MVVMRACPSGFSAALIVIDPVNLPGSLKSAIQTIKGSPESLMAASNCDGDAGLFESRLRNRAADNGRLVESSISVDVTPIPVARVPDAPTRTRWQPCLSILHSVGNPETFQSSFRGVAFEMAYCSVRVTGPKVMTTDRLKVEGGGGIRA